MASLVKHFLVTYLMPEKCYERIFLNLHVDAACVTFVMNKVAGLWIVLDVFVAQLLQLLKILWTGSTEGLSLPAVLLQLYAFSCPVVYAAASNFPFIAWAERFFMLVQTAAIVFLILHHRGRTLTALLFVPTYATVTFLLGSRASAAVISLTQTTSLTALIASKLCQAAANCCQGHTGQLSSPSVLLSCAGSLGLLVVSVKDTGVSLAAAPHALSAGLSGVLLSQVVCGRRGAKQKRE